MHLRPLTVIVLMLAASPAAADDRSAIRLFAPVPSGPAPVGQTLLEQAQAVQTPVSQVEPIRLFSPVPNASLPSEPAAPAMRGAVREAMPKKTRSFSAGGSSAERPWTVAQP